jgi:CBS domain-containing protein
MQVRDVMKPGLSNIAEDAAIFTAARLMRDLDVGMLPVEQNGEIVGTVTDRDITVRATASGANPITTPVSRVMSTEVFTCLEDDDLQQAARIMEEHQIRRLMVQNSSGGFIGMLTLADLARHRGMDRLSGEILEEVSQPSASAQPGPAH